MALPEEIVEEWDVHNVSSSPVEGYLAHGSPWQLPRVEISGSCLVTRKHQVTARLRSRRLDWSARSVHWRKRILNPPLYSEHKNFTSVISKKAYLKLGKMSNWNLLIMTESVVRTCSGGGASVVATSSENSRVARKPL